MPAHTRSGGVSADGDAIELTTLERDGVRARFASFGATLVSLELPDRRGERADVVLGFDSLAAYESAANPYFGGTIGRCANRIAGARFTLDGRELRLNANDGRHHLHGGRRGFDRVAWAGELGRNGSSVAFSRRSPAGEEGYPGEVRVTATFALLPERTLSIRYEATSDAPTLVDLTHHSYFDLGGSGTIAEHELEIDAARRVVVDDELIPTGELAHVAGTAFDFAHGPRRIGAGLGELAATSAGGYDVCYVIEGSPGELRRACRLSEPSSGRALEVLTTQPGLQLYTGNRLANVTGKRGRVYPRFGGVCLETQHLPDAVHHPHFPSVTLRPGERYAQTTLLCFSIAR
jgi:aldose 1-epimerase